MNERYHWDGMRWLHFIELPCGAEFRSDAEASAHYLECEECDRIHRERNFEFHEYRSTI